MRIISLARGLVLVISSIALVTTAGAATLTWTNTGSGAWSNSQNWSPQQVPTSADHAIIALGSVTVTPAATFGILDFNGGAIAGDLVVASNAVMNWFSGNTAGPGSLTVLSNGVLNLSGTGTKMLYTPLTNWGTVAWSGTGQWWLNNSHFATAAGAIYNQPGGLLDMQSDSTFYDAAGAGYPFISNAGTVLKSAGSGTTSVPVQFTNTGAVNVQSGTFSLQLGGSVGGQFTTVSGTIINLAAGNFVQSGTPTFSGGGTSRLTGGTLTLTSDLIPGFTLNGGTLLLAATFQGGSITNLTITGATVLADTNIVTGTVTLGGGALGFLTVASNAVLNWTGGTWTGPGSLTVLSNGLLNVSGTAAKILNVPLTNWGNVVWSGTGQWWMNNGNNPTFAGAIYNQPGALFDIQNDSTFYDAFGLGYPFLNNAGTVRKSAGSGITSFPIKFNNTGVVNVLSGTLALQQGGNIGGQFTTASATAINLTAGNFLQSGAPTFSGSGTSQVTGGTLTLFSDLIPGLVLNGGTLLLAPSFQGGSITNLALVSTVLTGTNLVTGTLTLGGGASATLTVASNAVVNWTGGTLATPGSLTVLSNGVLNVSGSATKTLNVPLTNWGNVVWSGTGQWWMNNGNNSSFAGGIYNQPGALLDFQNDSTFYDSLGAGYAFISNAGTVRKSAGSGTTGVPIKFNDTGTVNVLTGTLALQQGGSIGGQFTTATGTTINLAAGNFIQSGTPTFSGSGVSQFIGGTLTLFSDLIPGLVLNGGTLLLAPSFQGGSITNLTIAGATVLAGTNVVTGTATLNGGLSGVMTVAASAVLNWTGGSLTGPGALTVLSNGLLNVSGSATKSLWMPLTNWGNVVWSGTGQWWLYNAGNNSSAAGAIFNQPGALLDIQNDALMYLNLGHEFINNAGTFRKSAGSGVTTIYPPITNSSVVLAQSGTLLFNNAYVGSAASALGVSLTSTNPGTGFGKIQFVTTNTLTGNFTVTTGSYRPNPGNSFLVLSFPGVLGDFTSLSGLDLGSGLRFAPRSTATSMSLVATTYPITATPRLSMDRSLKGFFVAWPTNFSGWTLQTATNLTAPVWTTVSVSGVNNTVLPPAGPQQYFRLLQ